METLQTDFFLVSFASHLFCSNSITLIDSRTSLLSELCPISRLISPTQFKIWLNFPQKPETTAGKIGTRRRYSVEKQVTLTRLLWNWWLPFGPVCLPSKGVLFHWFWGEKCHVIFLENYFSRDVPIRGNYLKAKQVGSNFINSLKICETYFHKVENCGSLKNYKPKK